MIQELKLRILRQTLKLSQADFSLFLEGLRQKGLRPKVDLSENGYLHILFETEDGVIQPASDEHLGDIAGWAVTLEKKRIRPRPKTELNMLRKQNRSYQRIVGGTDAAIDLFTPQKLNAFIQQVRQEMSENHPDLLPETSLAPPEQLQFIEEIIDYLQPFFTPQGLELVPARQVIKQSPAEVALREEMRLETQFPKVDILIVKKDVPGLNVEYVNMLGWGKINSEDRSLTIYGSVCGFVIVADNTTLHDRKILARNASSDLRVRYATQPKAVILTIDPSLIEAWSANGNPFPTAEKVTETLQNTPNKKLVDFGFYQGFNLNKLPPPTVEVHLYEPEVSHIGGTQITVVVKRDAKVSNAVLLDRGWIFDLIPSWGNLGKGPQYVDGMTSFLNSGMYDKTRRLYRLDLLVNSFRTLNIEQVVSAANGPENLNGFCSVEEFVTLELYHRLGPEEFVNLCQELQPRYVQQLRVRQGWRSLMKYIDTRHKKLYAQKTIFDLAGITHAHQDHTLGFSLVRDEIVRGFSGTTRALLLADHKISSNWLAQDVAIRKMRELPKIGSAYPVYEFPYLPFEDGTKIEVSPGIFVSSFEVYHSIPGSMGFMVDVEHKGKQIASVAYGGDYRDGRFFERVGEAGGTDLLIVEGTNPPSAGAHKESLHYNEEDVREHFSEAFLAANSREDLVVIDLVKSAFERLEHIIEIATVRGRSIVLSSKILKRLQLVQMVTQGQQQLPNVHPDDPNIFVWKPQKSVYKPEEREMLERYGAVTVTDLAQHPERYVLIRENEKPEKLEDLGQRVTWIDSTYGPYTEAARQEKQDRKTFAQHHGWTHLAKGFHATGHGPIIDVDEPGADESVLGKLSAAHAKTILPIHTQRRGEVAKVLQGYDPDAKIIGRLNHPRSKITLS